MDQQINNEMTNHVSERFTALLMANQRRIYGYILSLVPNPSDADDILQETALIMCKKFSEYKADTSFHSWAIKISYFTIVNFNRKKQRRSVKLRDDIFRMIANAQQEIHSDNYSERADSLKSCTEALKPKDREIIDLHFNKGLKVVDIAQQVGRSADTLYKSISRIIIILRQCIQKKLST